MSEEYNLNDVFKVLKKWRRKIIMATFGIAVISVIVSLLMPNYYKAETIFYAASPDLAEPIPIGGLDKNVRIYGDDNDLDRLFTIALSYELSQFLIDSFNLYKHYDIDPEDSKAKFKVRQELLDNFQTIKTKYGALQLMVEDHDPQMAAAIANAAREKIGNIAQIIVKESQKNLLQGYEQNLTIKQTQSDSLAGQIRRLKLENNILDTRTQGEIYTSLITRTTADLEEAKAKYLYYKNNRLNKDSIDKYAARESGFRSKLEKIKTENLVYARIVSPILQMEREQERIIDQIALDKERKKQLAASIYAPFTSLHLVEAAQIPVQKSRPKRSVWVILATLIGFLMSCIGVYVAENYGKHQS